MSAKALYRSCPVLSFAALALTCAGQIAGAPGSFPESPGASQRAPVTPASTATPSAQAAAQTTAAAPGRPAYATSPLLDSPAQPADVKLADGKLSIKANNSSLTAILHQLGKDTGMTIDGLSRDQRIFGVYGPGSPREILSELLDGAGYNVLMLGSTDSGAPRELQLSIRSSAPLPAAQPTNIAQQQEDEEDEAPPAPLSYPPAGLTPPHPAGATPNQPPPPNGGVKSPQQLLQELQRMRQQQQQQQQQQPQ
ncbi:MAG TPA: hypothetical protein VJV22_11790 [Acidobacteriaceae bacterium]|nr:hypothetical protein [Acidobacteriaceae bacterium]